MDICGLRLEPVGGDAAFPASRCSEYVGVHIRAASNRTAAGINTKIDGVNIVLPLPIPELVVTAMLLRLYVNRFEMEQLGNLAHDQRRASRIDQ